MCRVVSCEEAKQIDLVNYLHSLGYSADKISHNDYWFLSPLREEKTASFKVNRKLNLWYDFGLGKGGNFVDFGILFHRCTMAELLQKLGNISLVPTPVFITQKNTNPKHYFGLSIHFT